MPAVQSTMLPLGTVAPPFELPDVRSGSLVRSDDLRGAALLVMFICRHCPYVVHVRRGLAQLGDDYGDRAAIVAISSNDASAYPDDAPDSLAEFADTEGFTFPLLYDESQEVARSYDAACTPDLYVFDADRKLVYRGQLDDSRPGNAIPVTGAAVRAALDAVLAGRPVDPDQLPSMGCSIKWKDS